MSQALAPPRSAYRVLEARATLTVVGVLVACGAAAWAWTAASADGMDPMGSMAVGLAPFRTADMPFAMSASAFLLMWAAMMVAMMLPTVGPIVLLHRLVARRRGEGPAATVAFVAGYLAVWTVVGVVPFGLLVAARAVPGESWVAPTSAGVLVLAGAYQFTRWKETCQRACRSPLGFLMTHDFGRGLRSAARVGANHAAYCIGCCWALMAVLVVVGLTNLVWMALIALVFLVEKHWSHAAQLGQALGILLVVLGLAVLARPDVLDRLAG